MQTVSQHTCETQSHAGETYLKCRCSVSGG